MREIVVDTETTGLDPFDGHRIVEVACVELLNRIRTGASFHCYLDPERDMPEEAFRIHGLSRDFLAGQKRFRDIAEELHDFLADAPLVIHNAAFDMSFLNAELERAGARLLERDRVVDTLLLARRRQPGASNSLDSLCQRFGIDLSRRDRHGALLDAELLAEVYLELLGGRQATLMLDAMSADERIQVRITRTRPQPLIPRLDEEDATIHRAFVDTLGGGKAIWLDYLPEVGAA